MTSGLRGDSDAQMRGIIDVHLHGACLPQGAGLWNHLGSCRNIYVQQTVTSVMNVIADVRTFVSLLLCSQICS